MGSVSEEILELWNIDAGSGSDDYDQTAEDDNDNKPEFDELVEEVADKLQGFDPPELSCQKNEEPEMESPESTEEIDNKKEEDLEESLESLTETQEESKKSSINEMAETIIKEELEKTSEPEIDMDEIFSSSDKGNEEEKADIEVDAEASIEKTEPQESHSADLPDEPKDSNAESGGFEDEAEQEGSETMTTDIESILGNSDISWLLDSPAEKYDRFYAEKRKFLPSLLPGGLVPVSQYESMLRKAHVDIDIGSYDADTAHSKMMECQQWRNRLQEVFIHVNFQYRRWDRAVDLFRGVLARVEYEKPAARQEGVVYQHMRDMEMYLKHLEGLHDALNHVMKNIEAAWETMSRRVTIALPSSNREAERYSPPRQNASPAPKESPKESPKEPEDDFGGLGDFDSIGEGKPTVKNENGTSTQEVEF